MSTGSPYEVRRVSKTAMTIELITSRELPPRYWQLYISLAGSDSKRHWTWLPAADGTLDAAALSDLITVIGEMISDEISTRGGIQGTLPFGG